MVVDLICTAGERLVDRFDRRQLFPAHREVRKVEKFDCVRLAYHRGDGLAAESRLIVREYWLIGEGRDDSVAIDARDVAGREDTAHAPVPLDELIQISQHKAGTMIRATNDPDCQGVSGNLVGAEDFGALNFLA